MGGRMMDNLFKEILMYGYACLLDRTHCIFISEKSLVKRLFEKCWFCICGFCIIFNQLYINFFIKKTMLDDLHFQISKPTAKLQYSVSYWFKTDMCPWNRIESPEINPSVNGCVLILIILSNALPIKCYGTK